MSVTYAICPNDNFIKRSTNSANPEMFELSWKVGSWRYVIHRMNVLCKSQLSQSSSSTLLRPLPCRRRWLCKFASTNETLLIDLLLCRPFTTIDGFVVLQARGLMPPVYGLIIWGKLIHLASHVLTSCSNCANNLSIVWRVDSSGC